jgi:hypothetical protein
VEEEKRKEEQQKIRREKIKLRKEKRFSHLIRVNREVMKWKVHRNIERD